LVLKASRRGEKRHWRDGGVDGKELLKRIWGRGELKSTKLDFTVVLGCILIQVSLNILLRGIDPYKGTGKLGKYSCIPWFFQNTNWNSHT
jgi:hypothetical protein